MSFGAIYSVTWFGNSNESNGWGIVYPFNADGSFLRADTTSVSSDTTLYKADATQY